MSQQVEVWKDVEGYEGIYQISNLGRVKSLARQVLQFGGKYLKSKKQTVKQTDEKILSISDNGTVALCKGYGQKRYKIADLIENHF